jgi:hypothetical protein
VNYVIWKVNGSRWIMLCEDGKWMELAQDHVQ